MTGRRPNIDFQKKAWIICCVSPHQECGCENISFPIGPEHLSFDLYVVDMYVHLLLSLADMNRLKVIYNIVQDILVQDPTGLKISVCRQWGHDFLRWAITGVSCYTTSDLQRLHRRFGHPHSLKLYSLLQKKGGTDADTFPILRQIGQQCNPCQRHDKPPRRFKFTMRDEVAFKHSIYA